MKLFGSYSGQKALPAKKSVRIMGRVVASLLVVVVFFGVAGGTFLLLTWGVGPWNHTVYTPPSPNDGEQIDDTPPPLADPSPVSLESPAPSPSPSPMKEKFYTIILAGTDHEGYNSDTLMVAALDLENGELHVVGIPRDTQVEYTAGHVRKINAAWGSGGIEELQRELYSLLGFAPEAYAVVNLNGFVRLVNAVDGVDFTVPRDMDWDDDYQNLHIHLQKGPQHLTGEKAIQLMRYRQSNDGTGYTDMQRMETQQKFLMAVAKKTLKLGNAFKLPEFMDIAAKNLKTNLSLGDMLWFGDKLMELDVENIHFYTLPGDPEAYYQKQNYYLLNEEKCLELINQTINPYTEDITEVTMPQVRSN